MELTGKYKGSINEKATIELPPVDVEKIKIDDKVLVEVRIHKKFDDDYYITNPILGDNIVYHFPAPQEKIEKVELKEIIGRELKKSEERIIAEFKSIFEQPQPEMMSRNRSQSQESLNDQLWQVMRLANKNGYYDAADFIQEKLVKPPVAPKFCTGHMETFRVENDICQKCGLPVDPTKPDPSEKTPEKVELPETIKQFVPFDETVCLETINALIRYLRQERGEK